MGYGDDIMVTGEARVLAAENPGARIIVGDGRQEYWSPLFDNNPHIARLSEVRNGEKIVWLRNHFGARPYLEYPVAPDFQTFRPYKATRGEVFPSIADRRFAMAFVSSLALRGPPLVMIEPNVDFGVCKDWGFDRYQKIVEGLKEKVVFVQADYGKSLLRNVFSFDSPSFLRACAVLEHCDLYLGPEGGMHHAAAALGKRAIVLFGGRIHPDITGYPFHHNLYVDIDGSPCGSIAPCRHCVRCFDLIEVEQVVELVAEKCERRSGQLWTSSGSDSWSVDNRAS